MRVCDRHMDAIAAEVRHRGLWHLVARDQEIARERAYAWLMGTCSREHIDPLVIITLEVLAKARSLGIDAPGPRCPICETERHRRHPNLGPLWIGQFAEQVVELLRHNEVIA